jgi:hypothetical protein
MMFHHDHSFELFTAPCMTEAYSIKATKFAAGCRMSSCRGREGYGHPAAKAVTPSWATVLGNFDKTITGMCNQEILLRKINLFKIALNIFTSSSSLNRIKPEYKQIDQGKVQVRILGNSWQQFKGMISG